LNIQLSDLTIDAFSLSDRSFIYDITNTPGWLKYIGDRQIHGLSEAEEYLKNGPLHDYAHSIYGLHAIRKDNQPIGMCGLLKRAYLSHPDLGYALLPDHYGRGIMYRVCTEVLAHYKARHDLELIYAIVTADNKASINLLKRLRFSYVDDLEHNGAQVQRFSLYL